MGSGSGSPALVGFAVASASPRLARIADDLKLVVAAIHHCSEGLEVRNAVNDLDVLVRHAAADDVRLAGDGG